MQVHELWWNRQRILPSINESCRWHYCVLNQYFGNYWGGGNYQWMATICRNRIRNNGWAITSSISHRNWLCHTMNIVNLKNIHLLNVVVSWKSCRIFKGCHWFLKELFCTLLYPLCVHLHSDNKIHQSIVLLYFTYISRVLHIVSTYSSVCVLFL